MSPRLTVEQIDALPLYDLADCGTEHSGYVVGIVRDVGEMIDADFMLDVLACLPSKFSVSHLGLWDDRLRRWFLDALRARRFASRFETRAPVDDLTKWWKYRSILVVRSGEPSDVADDDELLALACGRSVIKSLDSRRAAYEAMCELECWSGGYARKNREWARAFAERNALAD